jgi:hypothetical protein
MLFLFYFIICDRMSKAMVARTYDLQVKLPMGIDMQSAILACTPTSAGIWGNLKTGTLMSGGFGLSLKVAAGTLEFLAGQERKSGSLPTGKKEAMFVAVGLYLTNYFYFYICQKTKFCGISL